MAAKKQKENGVKLPFIETDFIEKWGEWLQYRKERHLSGYTPTGLKRTFNKLKEDSNNSYMIAIQIIDQSLAMGWQGLFPIKNINNNHYGINTITEQPRMGTSEARIKTAKNW